ncbi:MAG: PHB depolymerase family esterase [Phycisphaerae bacterium]|nr:PHB depolymerase family esterase [Phycisphaerae bacterium]
MTMLAGCPIPQSPGKGKTQYRQCRTTNRNYWLYKPANYNNERRYPLVVTLHGMKPYDVSRHHVEMWGSLADRHGFIILAPELSTSDSFGQFPLRHMGAAENHDVQHVLACMDEVMADCEVDRNAVMMSSWSMGGYLAHFIMTEYGHRFTCFAPLQSNFSTDVLNPSKARQWSTRIPMFVFYGTADFPAVTNESKDAIEWYRRLGYTVSTKKEAIGHQRHPELAAEFFENVLSRRQRNVDIVVTPPGTEPAPLAVNLWPALSSKIGDVKTYIWDFGRLSEIPSYQKSPNVLIRQPGEYPIKLTVVDKAGVRYTAATTLRVPAVKSAQGTSLAPHTP